MARTNRWISAVFPTTGSSPARRSRRSTSFEASPLSSSRRTPTAVRNFVSGSSEGEASLRVRGSQAWRHGWWHAVHSQAEGTEEGDFDPGEEQGGAGREAAGCGVMQDAQQHEGDERHVDLDADGVFAAAEEAADLEVLLEPLEHE